MTVKVVRLFHFVDWAFGLLLLHYPVDAVWGTDQETNCSTDEAISISCRTFVSEGVALVVVWVVGPALVAVYSSPRIIP